MSFLLALTLACEEDKTSAISTISHGKHHNMVCKVLNMLQLFESAQRDGQCLTKTKKIPGNLCPGL